MSLKTMICDVRRFFLYNFLKGYVFISLAKRKGECLKCGKCCEGCFALINNACSIWKDKPRICHKDFPIDKFEQLCYGIKDSCGYYWKK